MLFRLILGYQTKGKLCPRINIIIYDHRFTFIIYDHRFTCGVYSPHICNIIICMFDHTLSFDKFECHIPWEWSSGQGYIHINYYIILCIHAGLLSFKYGLFPEEIQQDTINVRLRKIVESENNSGVEAVQKVLDLYKSCMDTTTIESRGIQPLFELINQTGGYHVMH